MPSHRGKQKRAQKQKRKRAAAQKARSSRVDDITRRYLEAQKKAGLGGPKEDLTSVCGYDAEVGPDGPGWLALDEEEQMARVAKYHERIQKPGEEPPNVQRHVGMHVLVEQQIARNQPPEAAQALARLRRDGMSRHDAVHAIGFILTEHMKRAMESRTPVDESAYGRELSQLTLKSWLQLARSILT
ncbi:MAG TPA: DUF1841 family protein [Polyangiaceae bacterium]|nr:DUF1841 family protein [Polyangiaceae bacterium]